VSLSLPCSTLITHQRLKKALDLDIEQHFDEGIVLNRAGRLRHRATGDVQAA
jgi:hypothetical protein